jgi:general secretion pathway protein I
MSQRTATRRGMPVRRGFTLLEVLVAVAILGIGVTAIFSAQWVSFASIKHARNESEAIGLVRCKMSEVEFDLEQNGFQLTDVEESGPCCDDLDKPGMTCSWSVTKPEFPEAQFGQLDLDTELDFKGGPSFLGGGPGNAAAPGGAAMSFLTAGSSTFAQQSGDVSDVADSFLGGGDGVVDGIAAMVMQIVFPDLKAIFEAGTRRVNVRVTWFEGKREQSIEIEQWVTNAKEAGVYANLGGLIGGGDDEEDPTQPPTPPKKQDGR